ncbi:hypothetical protein A2630_01010 [Candidatus Woesebacteria bacterium RIFCSPHIGHO2_01_FULL_44_10]|nr:MAG: hypothetical protein A2630_01010 [Candidatus Woesebacteria bacterium RIFCSPHIGHO2_01_FULL_44_10]
MRKAGFTLPELIVVIGIVLALFGIAAVNLVGVQRRSYLDTTVSKLLIDIKEQQTRAMAGDTQDGDQQGDFGIYFEANKYTFFDGFEVMLDPSVSISSVGFPGSTLVFEKITGEVVGFTAGADFVSISDSASGLSKTIRLNRFGSINVE